MKDVLFLLQIVRLKQEAEETEKALRERIQRLEMSRLQLEEEVSHLKTANMTDKLHAEEHISIAKQKVKSEEVCCNNNEISLWTFCWPYKRY